MVATCCGADVYYERTGSGKKRVVLLHGWGCSTELMRPVEQALSKDMEVLSLDFPGFGKSGRPPEPWGVPEYADCLRELLEKEDFLPCSVIAHSFGARVAIFLASRDHCLFDRMVLTGAAGIRKPQTEEQKKKSQRYQKLKKLYLGLEKVKPFQSLAESGLKALQQKYGSADYNALSDEMKKTFVKVVNEDLSPLLPRIQASTLLVWGEKDDSTPLWMGQKMEKAIPDAGLVVFEGDDHFAYLRQWPRFVTVVRAFLK